ncbi:Hypothetical predicted protein [Pelobates cultripes]|uniref:Uncharacterized protein n=1 Tax=Pelobates cultripes TaxID=61616 RepID=A0AAD1VRX2_PELCU|nr:Hypothetical predicted protein [Pelobates cultripes]
MPEKKNKKKGKESKEVNTAVLKRFLKTYENHCSGAQSLASPTITRALKKCIQTETRYVKIILSCLENPPEDTPPVLLQPLLMTIRDERYMLGTEFHIWGIPLSNQDVASLAILLELNGRTCYPFCKLDAIDCSIDVWSSQRLGRAIKYSQLTSISLDYNDLHDEGVQGLVDGLEGNKKVVSLSLCYCNLGPTSGKLLGNVLAETAVSELYLDGNYLECSGAVDLITVIAEYAQSQVSEEKVDAATNLAHQILEADQSVGIHTAVSGHSANTAQPENKLGKSIGKKKGKRKGKKKQKTICVPGPWVSKLHLADNGIDSRGKEGEIRVLEFTQLLSCLIRYSEQLSELNLDDNCLGQLAANDILEALTERNTRKLPRLKIRVIEQIPAAIFKEILKQSGKLKVSKKKRKKKKR